MFERPFGYPPTMVSCRNLHGPGPVTGSYREFENGPHETRHIMDGMTTCSALCNKKLTNWLGQAKLCTI